MTNKKDIAVEALRANAKFLREIEDALSEAFFDRRDINITIGERTWNLEPMMSCKISLGVQCAREKDENEARAIEYANSHTKDSYERGRFFSNLPPFIFKNHFYPPEDDE